MTMPAGRYYIGDLCYVMHDEWDEFCSITIKDRECLDGEFSLSDGRRFATYGTAYGDGVYRSNIGTSHSVDAGLIGCVRIDDIRDNTYADIKDLGAVVEFDAPFETSQSDGVIRFGHVIIDTAGDDDDEYQDEKEYDYQD